MQPPPRLDLGNPPQPPHFPPPPYREETPPVPRPKSRLAKILPTLITLTAFGGLAVLAWFAYQEGKNPTSEEEVPVIKADKEPFKHAPENPGGEEIPNADKEVYNSFTGDKPKADAKKAETMPDSERPIDRSFLKQFAGTGEDDASNPSKQEAIAFGDKKPEPKFNPDAPLEAKPLPLAKGNEALPTPNTGGVETVKKAPVAEEAPAAKPAAEAEENAAAPEAQEVVKKATVTKPAKKAVAAKEAKKKAKIVGGPRVQLGAYHSDAEATREWKKIHTKHKGLLANAHMVVQKVEIAGKGTLFRLQAGGLKSKEAAHVLCKKLVAAGQGCFIVK